MSGLYKRKIKFRFARQTYKKKTSVTPRLCSFRVFKHALNSAEKMFYCSSFICYSAFQRLFSTIHACILHKCAELLLQHVVSFLSSMETVLKVCRVRVLSTEGVLQELSCSCLYFLASFLSLRLVMYAEQPLVYSTHPSLKKIEPFDHCIK